MGKGAALGGTQAAEQTAAARRALRQEYRQLYADAVEGKEQLEDVGCGLLKSMLDKVDRLHGKVEKPREHAVDADVFCHLTECGLTMASRGHATNQGRTPASLVLMLRQAYCADVNAPPTAPLAPDAFAWAALGAGAAASCAPAPGASCMLGPLTAGCKVRAATAAPGQRRRRAAAVPAGQAATARELGEEEQGGEEHKQETDRNMVTMWECLSRAGGAARFSSLVCNHQSFGQTVENVFTLSFLLRDRRVTLVHEGAQGVVVKAAPRGGAAATKAVQAVITFSAREWGLLKADVAPSDCLMPHRAPAGAAPAPGGSGGSNGGSGAGAPLRERQQQQQAGGGQRRRKSSPAAAGAGAGADKENILVSKGEEEGAEDEGMAPPTKRVRAGR